MQVPLNPAEHVVIHPVQDDQLDGAVPAVYKHKNMQKAKCLTFLYVNLNDSDLTISKGQLVKVMGQQISIFRFCRLL